MKKTKEQAELKVEKEVKTANGKKLDHEEEGEPHSVPNNGAEEAEAKKEEGDDVEEVLPAPGGPVVHSVDDDEAEDDAEKDGAEDGDGDSDDDDDEEEDVGTKYLCRPVGRAEDEDEDDSSESELEEFWIDKDDDDENERARKARLRSIYSDESRFGEDTSSGSEEDDDEAEVLGKRKRRYPRGYQK